MKTVSGPDDLIDEELSAVCFVRGYVELHFDGPVLRALSAIRIRDGANEFTASSDGWRDRLCILIGREVEDVLVDDKRAIVLRLSGDAELLIPLDESSRTGPEAAHFIASRGAPILVW